MQGAVCTTLLARILLSQIQNVKAGEVNSSDDACILVSDPTEDLHEKLEALFADSKPVNEDLVQLRG